MLSGQSCDQSVLSGQSCDQSVLSGQSCDQSVLSGQSCDQSVLSGQSRDQSVLSDFLAGPVVPTTRPHPQSNASCVPQGDPRVAEGTSASTSRHDYQQVCEALASVPHI